MQTKCGDGSIMICGRLGKDVETKRVGEKNSILSKFSVCAGERNIDGQNQAIWVNCTCWNDIGKAASTLKKGDYVFCVGKISKSTYTTRDGIEKEASELVCEFLTAVLKDALPSVDYSNNSTVDSSVDIPYSDDLPF